ncbi:MAG: peroxisomal assembly protein [Peltula sp. TS41687]|nr:MAG: peroxisomal assembly protein [Peltula sp. TS41687]
MVGTKPTYNHRRKQWRRASDRTALSADLIVDDTLQGELGLLSVDIYSALFGANDGDEAFSALLQMSTLITRSVLRLDIETATGETLTLGVEHIAITPWSSIDSYGISRSSWAVAPVQASSRHHAATEHTKPTIRLSASSTTFKQIQSHLDEVQRTSAREFRVPMKVGILDVVPIPLTHIYLDVDEGGIQKTERFDADRSMSIGSEKDADADDGNVSPMGVAGITRQDVTLVHNQEEVFRDQIREALRYPRVVHTRDVLRASLRSDTSAPLQLTLQVMSCEPVSQGAVTDDTRVVLTSMTSGGTSPSTGKPWFFRVHNFAPLVFEHGRPSEGKPFSAAEEEPTIDGSTLFDSARRSENGHLSSPGPVCHDLTDDFADYIIALKPPQVMMPTSPTSGSSHAGYFHDKHGLPQRSKFMGNELMSLAGDPQSILFAAQGLRQRISDSVLHPKPSMDADDEHRAFVRIPTLIKLGCFSGDWIRIEATQRELSELSEANSPASSQASQGLRDCRVAKVYGLPDEQFACLQLQGLSSSTEVISQNPLGKSSSFLPPVYLPPLLLANLGNSGYVRLRPLMSGLWSSRSNVKAWDFPQPLTVHSLSPPLAKEVTLLKLSTPLSTDRSSQNILLLALKTYFEDKRRLVKSGDLVAVSLDVSLRRYLAQAHPNGDEQSEIEELVSASLRSDATRVDISRGLLDLGFAWFKIGDVIPGTPSSEAGIHSGIWGGTVVVDPSSTRMIQAGIVKDKLPSAAVLHSEYYQSGNPGAVAPVEPELQKGMNRVTAQPYVSPTQRRLRELISVAVNPYSIHLSLPPLSILLCSGQRGAGKATAITRACANLGMHVFTIDAYDVVSGNGAGGADVKVEGMLRARSERAISCGPENCALFLKHIEALTAERMVTALRDIIDGVRVLVASTNDADNLAPGLRSLFMHELEMAVPDEEQRKGLLQDICMEKNLSIGSDVDLTAISMKTAALVAADLVDLVDRATWAQRLRVENLVRRMNRLKIWPGQITIRDIGLVGGEFVRCVTKSDFDEAVDAARKNFSDSIGAPKIPTVTWDDVGGLAHVKDAVLETIQLPLEYPELFAKGLKKRSGILFYGPPGTGKTLLAKAIATELSLNFFSVKGPELLNMYIGESEANVRRVFQRARDARPCVIFFDELDSVAPKRGNQGDSGGVMDRIVSQLLAELDGMSDDHDNAGGVFVIGATNRPDLLDAALLRPGRFDKLLYLGISDTHENQLTILEALTRKFDLEPSLSLQQVAERLPFTYTGADLYALCSDAMLKAVARRISLVEEKIKALPGEPVSTTYYLDHLATEEDSVIVVTEEDFSAAQRELVGSVSARELQHYDRVRRAFEQSEINPKGKGMADGVAKLKTPASSSHTQIDGAQQHNTAADKSAMSRRRSTSSPTPRLPRIV